VGKGGLKSVAVNRKKKWKSSAQVGNPWDGENNPGKKKERTEAGKNLEQRVGKAEKERSSVLLFCCRTKPKGVKRGREKKKKKKLGYHKKKEKKQKMGGA